ncbi:Centromere/kinetochore Zw10-domain-containing protein [Auriculariales sp. MPI-PUGE-AT-0066]|nr:Centromere/kinetochore Zw10-domain-containing protein [Auriculariales sp. MPI-PUGE-AT-0066]
MDRILDTIGETDARALTHAASTKWLDDIHSEIRDVKTRIHDLLVREDDAFIRQHSQAKSIRLRLTNISTQVDTLAEVVDDSQHGIVVSVTAALSNNQATQQQALNAKVLAEATQYLLKCTRDFEALSAHARKGQLANTPSACLDLLNALNAAPEPLSSAAATRNLQARVYTLQHKVQEQLAALLTHCIDVKRTPNFALSVLVTTKSPGSSHALSLRDICAAVRRETLNAHLNTLRKDLTACAFEPLVRSFATIDIQNTGDQHVLSLSTKSSDRPFATLTAMFDFLHTNLLPHLPKDIADDFATSLYAPISGAIIHQLLDQTLPETVHALPEYLALAKDAEVFETVLISRFGMESASSKDVADWVQRLPAYYERTRRDALLQEARSFILGKDDPTLVDAPREDVEQKVTPPVVKSADPTSYSPSSSSIGISTAAAGAATPTEKSESSDGTWDLEDSEDRPTAGRSSTDSWGFDDGDDENGGDNNEPKAEDTTSHSVASAQTKVESAPSIAVSKPKDDSSSGWGWDDDVDGEAVANADDGDLDDDPWESAWGDDTSTGKAPPASAPPQVSSFNTTTKPRTATRLEKKLAKARGASASSPQQLEGPGMHKAISSLHSSGGIASEPTSVQASPLPPSSPAPGTSTVRRPVEKETFLVSHTALAVLDIVRRTIDEGQELAESNVFDGFAVSSTNVAVRGRQITQASAAVLDLYCALVPVTDPAGSGNLSTSRAFRFSNECAYLAHAVAAVAIREPAIATVLSDSVTRLKETSAHWFEDSLDRRRDALLDVLSATDGFADIGDDDTFAQSRAVIEQLSKDLNRLAREWSNGTLTKRSKQQALGVLVDAVLDAMVSQILAFDDIPERESRHLAQLCAALLPMEDLFVDEPTGSSMVLVHVPTWLKFSYLTELLEASLADISYLFDEGALVDFETEELSRLIRALFADTPKRADAIAKISAGHSGDTNGHGQPYL